MRDLIASLLGGFTPQVVRLGAQGWLLFVTASVMAVVLLADHGACCVDGVVFATLVRWLCDGRTGDIGRGAIAGVVKRSRRVEGGASASAKVAEGTTLASWRRRAVSR